MASSAEPDITIYTGFQSKGTYVWSPFVSKLEARLRFAGLSYRVEMGSFSKSPRHKIPYIEIGTKDGGTELISDSTLISKRLVELGVAEDLNSKISPALKAQSLAIHALLEDKLYWYNTYEKWHENYYAMRDHVMGPIPYPIRIVAAMLAYRKNMAILYGQGSGRFTAEEMRAFRQQIFEGINDLLAEAKTKSKNAEEVFWVFGGPEPSEVDTVVFGFIVSTLVCNGTPDSQKFMKKLPAAVDYARRIHNRYFPDYESWPFHGAVDSGYKL